MRVSYTNLTGNLWVHQDGSPHESQSDFGCSGRLRARALDHLLAPPSVAEQQKALAKAGRPMHPFVVASATVPFSNLTLNQMVCTRLICQAQPWTRIKDPILRGMTRYLRKEAHLYGRRWAADEAKQIKLSLKKNFFAELKVSFSYSSLHSYSILTLLI